MGGDLLISELLQIIDDIVDGQIKSMNMSKAIQLDRVRVRENDEIEWGNLEGIINIL